MIRRWFDKLFVGPRRHPRPRKLSSRCSTMLQLESLEDRLVPSNLFVNGDFSAGNTGFTSQYTFASVGVGEATYDVGTNPLMDNPSGLSMGDHTTGTGNMMMVNGAMTAGLIVWSETVAVSANTSYSFALWMAQWSDPGSSSAYGNLAISINGVQIDSGGFTNTAAGIWQQYSTGWNSGSAVQALITIVDTNLLASGNDFALDDISLTGPALALTTQPNSVIVGNTLNAVTVSDINGSTPVAGATVTLGISSGTLTGTTTVVTNSSGLATFSGLSVNTIGTYTLTASATGASGATSNSFVIGPGLVVTTISDAVTHTGNSLRDALGLANSDAAAGKSDTITFASNLNGQTITLSQGSLAITGVGGTITISGNGLANTIVSGNNLTGLTIGSAIITGVTSTIQNLTFTNIEENPGGMTAGITNYGTLLMTSVTVTNTPVGAINDYGAMTLNSCTLTNSSATIGDLGGGFYQFSGIVTVNNCTINNNAVTEGAIYVGSGTLTITNSSVSNNTAVTYGGSGSNGGGFYIAGGTTTVVGCTINGNSATASGAGIYQVGGTLIVQPNSTGTATTINGNIASGNGGGIYLGAGSMTLAGDTMSGNSASNGGGIYQAGGTLIVQSGPSGTATTISSNTTSGTGAGIDIAGGSATITRSTISGNIATSASSTGGGDRQLRHLDR